MTLSTLLKKLDWRHKNTKFRYYVSVFTRAVLPAGLFRVSLNKKLRAIKKDDFEYIRDRVNYYNKLSSNISLSEKSTPLSEFKITKRQRAYYFDTYEYLRYFSLNLKFCFKFGDVTYVPDEPSIVKSRPLNIDNAFSMVLKLDKTRHFAYANDKNIFQNKKNMLVGRAVVRQPHRIKFYEMYFGHPMCDLGQINKEKNIQWIRGRLTIEEHLKYKFILCIEGNDVASNLKWVMSSQSLAVMPTPKFETWFMEGRLIPNHHYVLVKDDYSDLEERLQHYIEHADEALQIIKNANEYVSQFRNKKMEDIISLCVLEKYFYRTGQRNPINSSLYN